jgi:hypothetical protein
MVLISIVVDHSSFDLLKLFAQLDRCIKSILKGKGKKKLQMRERGHDIVDGFV